MHQAGADLGAPLCKIFAAWRGITIHDGLATYDETYGYNQYGYWKGDRRGFVVDCLRELAKVAEDHGIVLAMQNHGPDVVNNYQDVLSLIGDVGSPALKACMDINIEPEAESAEHAREMVAATGKLQVHSHFNAEFRRKPDGSVALAAGGYFDDRFWTRRVAYPAYVAALLASGYEGYIDWEFCHPAMQNGKPAGIDYVHEQTRLALEYMKEPAAQGPGEAQRPGLSAANHNCQLLQRHNGEDFQDRPKPGAPHETLTRRQDADRPHPNLDRRVLRQPGQAQRDDGGLGRHLLLRPPCPPKASGARLLV